MNLDWTEEQQMLRTMARDFLETECPKSIVRPLEEDEKGYSPELWKKMVDLGWMGLTFPEKYNGSAMEFLDLIVLIEEMGRNVTPGPFFETVVCGGLTILDAGSDAQKEEYLTKIANGEMIMSLAMVEESGTYTPSGISMQAIKQGDNYVLNGIKVFSSYANVAEYLLVVARTGGTTSEDGITVFLVDAKSPGISVTVLPSIAYDKQCEVSFTNVSVPKSKVLGEADKGWPVVARLLDRARIAKAAEMVGGCDWVVKTSVEYSKERVQYGRPIGSFQALQHYMANMWAYTENAKNLTYEAAWTCGSGLPCTKLVSMAKAYASKTYMFVAERGIQIHGGIGMTIDHDVGLYYRRAKAGELAYGTEDDQREMVAEALFAEGLA